MVVGIVDENIIVETRVFDFSRNTLKLDGTNSDRTRYYIRRWIRKCGLID